MSMIFKQVTEDPDQQQIGKHFGWYAKQRCTALVVAVLKVPSPPTDGNDQHLFPVRENGT